MARSLRIEYPGALYHVTSRGNRREDIYLDRGDRLILMEILDSVSIDLDPHPPGHRARRRFSFIRPPHLF